MRLGPQVCRERFAASRVARLGTTGSDGRPHVVPVTFAVLGDLVVMAVDDKPKSTTDLRRLRNIADNPSVCLLVDHYADDWTQLWWVRVDAVAEVVSTGADRETAIEALVAKYEQYQARTPVGPVVRARVTRWSGWAFSDRV